jgi:hypothetical protein
MRHGGDQVVHHQHEQHRHQDQHQRGAGLRLPRVAQEVLDLVAHHLGARRAAGEVGVGVVVAEHRQDRDHAGRHQAGHRQRQRDAQERLQRRGTEVAAGLDEPSVDAFERGVQRQDEERHVAVDQADDHGVPVAVEPVALSGIS